MPRPLNIQDTVTQTLKSPYVAIALRRGGQFEITASHGTPVAETLDLPLLYQGESIGLLSIAPRAPVEMFSIADQHLLQNIARQASAAAHAVRLAADLERSRERLLTAREEERLRLQRDLHDGLGPQLATLTLKVDTARNLLPDDPETGDRLLVEFKKQAQTAIGDIRRLVYDLRPPALDQLGLVPALRDYATIHGAPGGLHVTVETPVRLPALPASVQVAVYRIALEAITNVVRHARAWACIVRLKILDGSASGLRLEIQDDGRGLPPSFEAGVGLTSMRERAAELGGTCLIQRLSENGTRVLVTLPLTIKK